jgi:DHA1 family bicyclomycin/chloramphenicol resistance-like MFS transporter
MSMAMALAPAIGPMIGGVLQQAFGWPATFWLLVGFGAVMLVSVLALLGESNRHLDPLATSPARLVRNYGALLRHRRYVGYVLIVACSYSAIFSFISGSSFACRRRPMAPASASSASAISAAPSGPAG